MKHLTPFENYIPKWPTLRIFFFVVFSITAISNGGNELFFLTCSRFVQSHHFLSFFFNIFLFIIAIWFGRNWFLIFFLFFLFFSTINSPYHSSKFTIIFSHISTSFESCLLDLSSVWVFNLILNETTFRVWFISYIILFN